MFFVNNFMIIILVMNFTKGEICGIKQNKITKIVGGYEIRTFKYPWFVAIIELPFWGDYIKGNVICGGTLITPIKVLTAAHCLLPFKLPTKQLQVMTAVVNICENSGIKGRPHSIHKIHFHPKYSRDRRLYDAAILTLKTSSTFLPICLPKKRDRLPHNFQVIGFGNTEENGNIPCILQGINIENLKLKMCSNMLPMSTLIKGLIICAGGKNKDACTGDSGGPLQAIDKNNVHTLYGIVAFGVGCARPNFYGAYINVQKILPWVKRITVYN